MYRLTVRIRSDGTIRPNTNTLCGPLFGTEANTKRIFGTSTHSSEYGLFGVEAWEVCTYAFM